MNPKSREPHVGGINHFKIRGREKCYLQTEEIAREVSRKLEGRVSQWPKGKELWRMVPRSQEIYGMKISPELDSHTILKTRRVNDCR